MRGMCRFFFSPFRNTKSNGAEAFFFRTKRIQQHTLLCDCDHGSGNHTFFIISIPHTCRFLLSFVQVPFLSRMIIIRQLQHTHSAPRIFFYYLPLDFLSSFIHSSTVHPMHKTYALSSYGTFHDILSQRGTREREISGLWLGYYEPPCIFPLFFMFFFSSVLICQDSSIRDSKRIVICFISQFFYYYQSTISIQSH